jgi:hypothetical protein
VFRGECWGADGADSVIDTGIADLMCGGPGNDFVLAYDRLAITMRAEFVDCSPAE